MNLSVLDVAKTLSPEIVAWRRNLHKIPETGLILPKTAAYIVNALQDMDIPCTTYPNHSGIVAVLGKGGGKCIALRADTDGLKIQEEVDVPYASENDNMHACGHDAHTAMVLGAAKMLKSREDKLNGQVKLIFQPAEEGPGGALPMIQDGVLENPRVDAILGMHVERQVYPSVGACKNGDVLVKYGNSTAADDQVDITVIGRGGHGSMPQACVDPVAIASLLVTALQLIVSREVSPFVPCVITFGSLLAGRGAENIIPDTAELRGTIRNQDLATRDFVFRRIQEVTEHICKAMRADYTLRFRDGYPPTKNDDAIVDSFLASARKVFPEEDVHIYTEDIMGGDDAGFFYQQLPGCYFRLHAPMAFSDGVVYPAHNARFAIDDSVLYRGTAALVQGALDLLAAE